MAIILPKSYSQDVAQPVTVRHGGGLLFTGNAAADTITVTLYKDGAAYSPGGSVALKCIRADGVTVAVVGSISGNVATATLTANCCTVPGPLAVVMQITSGGTVGAVFAAVYNVEQSATGTVVAADNMLDDIDALIAEIQAAVASVPADYTELLATIAPTFSASTAYAAGDYVWYDAVLYRFTADHAAGTWTGMDAAAVVIGNEIGELKSATNYEYSQLNTDLGRTVQLINRFDASTAVVGRVNSSGVGVDSSVTGEFTSDFIDVSDLTEIVIGRFLSSWAPTNVYYCLYNVSKNPIGTRTTGKTITVTGAYFIRFSGSANDKQYFMLVDSSYTPARYVAYDRKVSFDFSNLHEKVDKLGLSQINERNTTFFEQSKNLYNKATSEADTRLDGDGTTTTGNGYTTSDYINVFGISSVTFYNVVTTPATVGVYYCFYNESKQLIGSRQVASSVAVPSGAVYLRVSIDSTKNDVFMIVDSTFTPTQYLDYGYKFKYNDEVVHITPADDVIQMLIENAGKEIVFDDGEYDIISIYESKYGSDYFTNYAGYSTSNVADRGLPILRGTKVTFSQGAYFTAEYTGDNTNVPGYFAAFALESDVTIDGLRLHTSRVRNPIHDDFGNFSSGTTIIRNCHITTDKVCIAGGLGQHDNVIIENNYFATTRTGNYDISYHNSSIANAQSNMIICNNYFAKGIRVAYYGTTTELTDVLISGNSMAYDVTFEPETESSTVVNMAVKKWGNEIRS